MLALKGRVSRFVQERALQSRNQDMTDSLRAPRRATVRAALAASTIAAAIIPTLTGVATAAAPPSPHAATAGPGGNPDPHASLSPYFVATTSGAVWNLGGAPSLSSAVAGPGDRPVSSIAAAAGDSGYWLATSNGNVFNFGSARWFGSLGARTAPTPVDGIAPTSSDSGYWLVTSGGNVFNFGAAAWYGSAVGRPAGGAPIEGIVPNRTGDGYWLFASNGSVYPFGAARWYGSAASRPLTSAVVGLTPTPDGGGYWLSTAAGNVIPFGDASFYGSAAMTVTQAPTWSTPSGSLAGTAAQPFEKLVPTSDGRGYWQLTSTGDSYAYGDARPGAAPSTALMFDPVTPGQRALAFAMAQQGKPYVWGATGPAGFDCSGLTETSWANAGVYIPRVAADQYASVAKVSISSLAPGDLVFWASNPAKPSTIQHVAMYVGGGHMVNAPYTGTVVRTDWIGGPGFVPAAARP